MRLRLTIQRHGLPETRVIWVINTSSAPTVFQLLEQVNETLPIESDGEWGLEDYAVEVKGFNGVNYECLHFQLVDSAMKEEDEVIIRPLLSKDLKIRRLSGRHQISMDGKHLVDGLAFGRPLLRKPADRPPLNIPPRKKRRITYNEEDGGEDEDEDERRFPALGHSGEERNTERQIILHADFEDDEDEDEDFEPGEDENSKEDSEGSDHYLEDDEDKRDEDSESLHSESRNGEQESSDTDSHEVYANKFLDRGSELNNRHEAALSGVKDPATRSMIRKLHSAFPTAPLAVCKYVLDGTDGDIGEAFEALNVEFFPVRAKSTIAEKSQAHPRQLLVPKTRSRTKTTPVQESENLDGMQVESDELNNSHVDFYDQNGMRSGAIKSGKALSFMAEVVKRSPAVPRPASRRSISGVSAKSVRFVLEDDLAIELKSTQPVNKEQQAEADTEGGSKGVSENESEDSSEDSSEESTSSSSSGSDSSDEDIQNIADETSSGSDGESDSKSDSESDGESGDSSDDSPEELSSKTSPVAGAKADTVPFSMSEAIDKGSISSTTVPPGKGKKTTRARNLRRKNSNVLRRLKEKGILPAGATLADFNKTRTNNDNILCTPPAELDAASVGNNSTEIEANVGQLSAKAEEFKRRKQELLDSIANGGIEVDQEGSSKALISKSSRLEFSTDIEISGSQPIEGPSSANSQYNDTGITKVMRGDSLGIEQTVSSLTPEASLLDVSTASPITRSLPDEPDHVSALSPRRAKIDLGAGRRLLFGALGIKAPKTKADEDKIRHDLMKDVRPLRSMKNLEESNSVDEISLNEDPEAWREKIIYRAVECVQEGIELSEPPFPFVQRWDPQQQASWSYNGNSGSKKKKNQRDQAQYYNDEPRASKKQKRRQGRNNYAEEQEYLDASYEPNYQEDMMYTQYDDSTQLSRIPSIDVDGEINQQLMNDIQTPSAVISQAPDDLAPLPDDPTILPDLQEGQVKVGMTLAFRTLEVSAASNWQPQISEYRTAIVIAILDTGELELTLAMRDRVESEKRYDSKTGERIYGKFEVPDDDDDEMEREDDGMLSLSFSEFIEPKIVQEPPTNLVADDSVDRISQARDGLYLDTPTAGQQEESVEAQFSHVTETLLDSNSPEINQPDLDDAESSLPKIPSADKSAVRPTTPVPMMVDEALVDKEASAESMSEESRQGTTHMMKEVGFHSSVSSSIIKNLRPDGVESPNETAVFQKLLKDMIEIPKEAPYSPRFNGLGSSSPSRGQRGPSKSPEKPPQSSWETFNQEDELSSSPIRQEPKLLIHATDVQGGSAPTGIQKKNQPTASRKPIALRKVPIGNAQKLWATFQAPKKRRSPDPEAMSSPDPGLSPNGDEREEPSVHYPKLSVGSSFTSYVSDHGHQPDSNFDVSALLNADTLKNSVSDVDGSHSSLEPERSPARLIDVETHVNIPADRESDDELQLPARGTFSAENNIHDASDDDDPSSDEPFLTLDQLLSQNSIHRAKVAGAAGPTKHSDADERYKKQIEAADEDMFGSDDQTTPKASHPQPSAIRTSQSRTSQSQSNFVVPRGSQVMDLTLSSDAEPDAREEESDDAGPTAFRKYSLNEDDDREYEDDETSDWAPKKSSTLRGVETRRRTNVGIKNYSQASPNTRNRRKTTSK